MTAYDRHEADRLLTRLLELPAGERLTVLDAACNDDTLRSAILRLLQAAEAPGSVIDPEDNWTDSLWEGLARQTAEHESPMAKDALVGPYRILDEIARGGTAVVYRAERVDGEFTRQVAVKVLKLGADTGEAARRFEQERQILANLNHPNIARMFDAGRTDDGQPYLVMELIEGLPIDRYCDDRRLSIKERLELFYVVTRAVESAHQNLVVHRDIKPSNVVVNQAGEVKLLDFGIARLLDSGTAGNAAAPATRALLRVMTPEYASPEQVRGERVTTASDTYQLGLLLYELLTGHRPYMFLRDTPGEFERVICDQAPTRPSASIAREHIPTRCDGSEATMENICRARRTLPAKLRRRLRGDLDNIVLMALHKEPRQRYRTADRLAQDIHRHLNSSPVTARQATWAYRGRKFFERHAIGATATALVLITAIGLTGFHTVRVQNERDRAQAEAAKVEQVSQFLIGLFESADPREAQGAELSARELLDRGVAQVDLELARQPDVQAQMLQVLGRTYLELGIEDEAEALLHRSLELRQARLGTTHPDVASTMTELGLLHYRQGSYEHARDLLEEAARNLEVSGSENASTRAYTLLMLGEVYGRLHKYEQAEATLKNALAIQGEISSPESVPAARLMHRLGVLYQIMGAHEQAEDLYNRALEIYEHELSTNHPEVGLILLDLARNLEDQGREEEVEAMYRRSITIQENAYGPTHTRLITPLNNLAGFLIAADRNDEAIEVLQRAGEIQSNRPNDLETAIPLNNLGGALLATGRLQEARDAFAHSAALRSESVGAQQFDALLFHTLVGLTRTETELGNHGAAEQASQRALGLWQRAPELIRDTRLEPSLLYLGQWLLNQQRCEEAIPLLGRAADLPAAQQDSLEETQQETIQDLLATCSEIQ